ncbi:MAG: hypothetical protein NTV97_26795 [Alphaproteobacteria bacterium]|nr:hypothetical protein [Alphaproteobacteria bacterium]
MRNILRGFENLPRELERISDLPPLKSLQSVLQFSQILQVIEVAQNAAMAASLRRIEKCLDSIDGRLSHIEASLKRVGTRMSLVLESLRALPVSRMKAAKAAAVNALRLNDATAMIGAGKDMQQAFHDLIAQTWHMVRVEEDGLPLALRLPAELADLAEISAEAASAASAVWLALGDERAAAGLMREAADAIDAVRQKMAMTFMDPELLLRRIRADERQDIALIEAGDRLRNAGLWSIGRAVMIEQHLISADPSRLEFEQVVVGDGITFTPVVEEVLASRSIREPVQSSSPPIK